MDSEPSLSDDPLLDSIIEMLIKYLENKKRGSHIEDRLDDIDRKLGNQVIPSPS